MKNELFTTFFLLGSISLIVSVFVACEENVANRETTIETLQDTQTRYGSNMITFIPLTTEAQEAVQQWSVFEDFQENAAALKNQTASSLQVKTEQIQRQTDSLLKQVPTILDTRPIVERLILVHTRVRLMHQEVHSSRLDSVRLERSLDEFSIAAQNLLVQINGKFNKNRIDNELRDIEKKELEKQQRFLDSVYQQELKDNSAQL